MKVGEVPYSATIQQDQAGDLQVTSLLFIPLSTVRPGANQSTVTSPPKKAQTPPALEVQHYPLL